MKRLYPNYKNNLVSFYNSLLKLIKKDKLETNKEIDKILKENTYQNIVILMYNGLNNQIVIDSGCSWLLQNKNSDLLVDYNSIISDSNGVFISNGTLFKDSFSFINKDIIENINNSNSIYTAYGVFPYGKEGYNNREEAVKQIVNLCKQDSKKIVFCYFDELGKIIRKTDCKNDDVFEYCRRIEKEVRNLSSLIDNSLIFVTSDYGYHDSNCTLLSSNKNIMKNIASYKKLSDRLISISLKSDNIAYFKRLVRNVYGESIIVFSKKEIINTKLFGIDSDVDGDVFLGCTDSIGFGPNCFGGLSLEEALMPLFVVRSHDCDLVIRVSKEKDYDFIYSALLEMKKKRELLRKDLVSSKKLLTKNDFLNLCNSSTNDLCFVIEKNGELIGFIILFLQDFDGGNKNKNYLFVDSIYVKKEYRRSGYGTKLILKAMEYSKNLHLSKIYVPMWYFDDELQEFVESIEGLEIFKLYELNYNSVK